MDLLYQLENSIDVNLAINEQISILEKFDNIEDKQILELGKLHKYTEAGILIEYLGFDRLQKHQEIFIQLLQDMNWPGAGGAARMFSKAEIKALPIVKRTLETVLNDDIWLDWIIIHIVDDWSRELVIELPILKELVERGINQGSAVRALRVLKEKDLVSKEFILEKYKYLSKKFETDKYALQDLREEIIFD
ncbi:MAG: hypothetical protein ACI8ZM_000329 [Crocinitomix sp.]|jgi:hypothetical protein